MTAYLSVSVPVAAIISHDIEPCQRPPQVGTSSHGAGRDKLRMVIVLGEGVVVCVRIHQLVLLHGELWVNHGVDTERARALLLHELVRWHGAALSGR